jgi:hypothetical protein
MAWLLFSVFLIKLQYSSSYMENIRVFRVFSFALVW